MSAETPSGEKRETEERLERIRRTRLYGVLKGVSFVLILALLFREALKAAGLIQSGTEYNTPYFLRKLTEFIPLTTYRGVPFVDFGAYLSFIGERDLLFASDISLLWADPPALISEVGAILVRDGFFALFGVAGVTLAVGVAGTVLGFPLALLFGVLGSERVLPFPLNFVFRGTMSAIRAIPALVWILIYIPLAGVTPVSAVFAVATDTIGNLGRLFTDELEEIEEGPIEAMETTGASRPQTVTFGMLSQVTTPYIAWTLYIFEINVRIAVSLGVLGAGGLGSVVKTQLGLTYFDNAMATLLCIFLLIISVELFSQRIRSRLRSETEKMSFRELVFGFPCRFTESLMR